MIALYKTPVMPLSNGYCGSWIITLWLKLPLTLT